MGFDSSAGWSAGEVVGLGRFELPTSRLSGGRSNQLSYRPTPSSQTDLRLVGPCSDDFVPFSKN